ncbi:MAG: hypothetical protein ACFWT0_05960 [Bifidobacterium crudilactis]|jgi:predicted SpoU family rRNA methylase|uniref:hypothetical protein n=1 Tax=Bifidobacterium crudilactis TaxID=327277 RepID=UPI003A5C6EF2
MKEKITQTKLKARLLGVDADLLIAVEQAHGAHTVEEWIEAWGASGTHTVQEYLESLMMPEDGIIGLYSTAQLQQEKGNDK